jgi:hypothetical protein
MSMRAALYWFALLVMAQTCFAQAGAVNHLLGKWTVKDVLCSDCGKRVPAERGTVLELTNARIRNPLGGSCHHDPGYDLVKEMTGAQVIADYGKRWPRSVTREIPKEDKIRYGFITCGGINLMQMLFLSDTRAFYFFEGGIVFDLQRDESSH